MENCRSCEDGIEGRVRVNKGKDERIEIRSGEEHLKITK